MVIYNQPHNECFYEKLAIKIAIADATQGTYSDKIYRELGLESLKSRRYKRSISLFKIMKKESPNYLFKFIPKCGEAIRTRNNNFVTYNFRADSFMYSFFPSTLNDWFLLDINKTISETFSLFKSRLTSFFNFSIGSPS